MLLAIDLGTGLVYSVGSTDTVASELSSLIRDNKLNPEELEAFIKNKFKESVIQKTLIFEN